MEPKYLCLLLLSILVASCAASCDRSTNCGSGYCSFFSDGSSDCVCYQGYKTNVTYCDSCDVGYVRSNVGACVSTVINPCANVDCGLGGTCRVENENALCACYAGYRNTGGITPCVNCAQGFELQNGRCVATNPCYNNPCSALANSQCVNSSSNAAGYDCVCVDGYFLAPNGACVLKPQQGGICATYQPYCGNGVCIDAITTNEGYVCVCAAGYETGYARDLTAGILRLRPCSVCASGYDSFVDDLGNVRCIQSQNPCYGVDCGIGGYCESQRGAAVCRCRSNFGKSSNDDRFPCDQCAPGYVNGNLTALLSFATTFIDVAVATRDTSNLLRCSECDVGWVKIGSSCLPPAQVDTCGTGCGPHGICQVVLSGMKTCVCQDGYMHDREDPIGRPCSVCSPERIGADPANGCMPPASNNLTDCMIRCRVSDPNSICEAVYNTADAASFAGFRCVCDSRYAQDEFGRCSRCAPGFYSVNGICDRERCFGGCGVGTCIIVTPDTGSVTAVDTLSFKCRCPAGYSGLNCETYTPPDETNPCGICLPGEVCARVRSVSTRDFNLTRDDAKARDRWMCTCPPNKEDHRQDDGVIERCSQCSAGWTGPNCEVRNQDDALICGRTNCPTYSACIVSRDALGNALATCRCPDGSIFNETTRCGLVEQSLSNPCDRASCPLNSRCVPAAETKTGVRCVCDEGFVSSYLETTGRVECLPPRQNGCPLKCPADQVCVDSVDLSGPLPLSVPKCKCLSPNAMMSNGTCVCRPGWIGDLCNQRVDPCLKAKCPNNTECVAVYTATSVSFKCDCAGSNTNTGCVKDVCASTTCPKGQQCNNVGQCVCPLNQIKDPQTGLCKDRPTPNTAPGNTTDLKCASPTAPGCKQPPPRRYAFRTVTPEGNIVIDLSDIPNMNQQSDKFSVTFKFGINGTFMALCMRRQLFLTDGTFSAKTDDTICLRMVSVDIMSIPPLDLGVAGTLRRRIPIGAKGADYNTKVIMTEKQKPNPSGNGTIYEFKMATVDGLLAITCTVAEAAAAVHDTMLLPHGAQCNIRMAVPQTYYKGSTNKVCFNAMVEQPANVFGTFYINEDTETYRVYYINAVDINTNVAFEKNAQVGKKKATIDYSKTDTPQQNVAVRGCINSFNPDIIIIDPQTMVGTAGINVGAAAPQSASGAPQAASAPTVANTIPPQAAKISEAWSIFSPVCAIYAIVAALLMLL